MTTAPEVSEERHFKGIWIPAEIWLHPNLTINEKVLLVEIYSLSEPEKPCLASNRQLAKFFGLSNNRISELVSSLKEKGFLAVEVFHKGDTKQVIKREITINQAQRIFSLDGVNA
jgi:hypothetical protein